MKLKGYDRGGVVVRAPRRVDWLDDVDKGLLLRLLALVVVVGKTVGKTVGTVVGVVLGGCLVVRKLSVRLSLVSPKRSSKLEVAFLEVFVLLLVVLLLLLLLPHLVRIDEEGVLVGATLPGVQ